MTMFYINPWKKENRRKKDLDIKSLSVIYSHCLCTQLLSEKISGVEGTKLDADFVEMERVS